MAWTYVMEPFLVVVILSCMVPMSVARVGWHSVDKGDLGGFVFKRDNAAFNHLVVQVVAFPCSLAHPGEDGVAAVRLGHVIDELHDEDSLVHNGAAEQTNLLLRAHILEFRSVLVDGVADGVDDPDDVFLRSSKSISGFTHHKRNHHLVQIIHLFNLSLFL